MLGTVNNCAGGVTPWGTYVMAEENFHGYFSGELPDDHRESRQLQALWAFPKAPMTGRRFYDRFDLGKEPNEPNRFGWIVEIDLVRPDLDAEEAHRARPLQA